MKIKKILLLSLALVVLPGCYNEWEDDYYDDFSFESDIQSTPFQRTRSMSESSTSRPDCLFWAIIKTWSEKMNNPTYENIEWYAQVIQGSWVENHGFTEQEADQIISHFVNASSHTSLPSSMLGSNLNKLIMIIPGNDVLLHHAVNAVKYFEEGGESKIKYIDYSERHEDGQYVIIPASSLERIYY